MIDNNDPTRDFLPVDFLPTAQRVLERTKRVARTIQERVYQMVGDAKCERWDDETDPGPANA